MYVVGCCSVERVGLIEKVGRRAGAISRPKVGGPRLDKTRARDLA